MISRASTSMSLRTRSRLSGHFSVFFSQTGGYSDRPETPRRNAIQRVFLSATTGTGSTAGGNDETIQGLELRYETLGP